MIKTGQIISFLFLFLHACAQPQPQPQFIDRNADRDSLNLIFPDGSTIETRILLPDEYSRIPAEKNSFSEFLKNLPLKQHNSSVTYFSGSIKQNNNVYDAVVDLPIGSKDLHQCADAVMRLRAEYLWKQKQFDKIHFNFTNGFRCDYAEWMKGKRVVIQGNSTFWKLSAEPSDSYETFWSYLEMVFSYAGTLSLSKELIAVKIEEMHIGDVFIVGGSPGHAVIVLDMAMDNKIGKKIFLLAQSYMPAQEIQILKNPLNPEISPWYLLDFGLTLFTPEWTFDRSDIKRFED